MPAIHTAMQAYGDAKGIELFWRDRKTFKNRGLLDLVFIP